MSERMQELALRQMENKLENIEFPEEMPDEGWIHAVRGALGMTHEQLAQRIGVTRPTVSEYEQRESKGTITLNSLRKAGEGMDCKLVYALVPKQDNLQEFRERQARETAERLVESTSHSMSLENQDVSEEEKTEQIDEITEELLNQWDSIIWETTDSETEELPESE